ncbi:hypothetical protein ABW286_22015 [Erwinia papayae]|uniref:Uncharacterized protein n=1 Tax=Erwinia papayae TaxID=206499 RepID=A0ABV3N7Z7_9GAMM
MSRDTKSSAAQLAEDGELRETAGRMYEVSDILQAIQTGHFGPYEKLARDLELRCEHLSNELMKGL